MAASTQKNVGERLKSLESVLPYLSNIHVFYWTENGKRERHPLQEAKDDWIKYLQVVSNVKFNTYAMLEFVRGDKVEQFIKDAAVLKEIASIVND